ncbi:DNA-binding CsgD family transcriptional regulator [Kitasatospora sp. GP30]|uniref:helix-turn-helix transcriptional regulator n=1 Tax=Kitasatospora sp. GP30 TaxID=3035084 RepID=UPI000C700EEC|nr:helix-turn-helix transcriptional regulator [Kitasatospora sp. GP30]MDH6138258.1 DNA-binding CsgD family transcriptional regulator [Kitasatospora sp. GP30]
MLYGRAGEQASVDALLAAARQGRSGVLVLRGEPGIGKSALLEYAAERADGFRVIRATGVEYEADLPFAGLQLLLSPALARLPVLPAPQRRALEAAFGLAEGGGLTERLLSALGTLGLLAELAAETPLLCLVDDAQWLDRSSADALLLTARRLDREGVVLLFAARDGEGEFSAPGLPELRLEPLDPSAAAELLAARAQTADGSAADAGLRYRVLAEARGNPLALTELPAAAAAGPVGSEGPVPLTGRLREAFLGQVARLPAPTRTLLLVAAAEEQGELAIVLRAAEGLGAGAADLPPAEQAGLLRRTPGDGRLALRHPLLRAAILEVAGLEEKLAVHRVLGAVLLANGQEDRGSWHLALATTGQDAELSAALERAGHRAADRAGHSGAAAAFERAARLASDRESATRCLTLAAEAALDAAQAQRARELAERAAKLTEEPFVLAVLEWVRGTAAFWRGDYPEAHRLLLTAVGREIDQAIAARGLLQAFHTAWYLGGEHVREVLRRLAALRLPAEDALGPLVGQLLAMVGPAFAEAVPDAGKVSADGGVPPLLAAARAARAAGADSPRDLVQFAGAALIAGRDAETFLLADELITEARAAGAVGLLPTLLFFRGEAELFHGRHRDAELAASEGLTLARDLGQPQWTSQLAALDAYLAALRGDGELVATRTAEALGEAVTAWGAPAAGTSWSQWALAVHDLGQGRAAEAVERLAGHTAGPYRHHVSAIRTVPDLVEAAVRLGAPERAEAAFEEFAAWSARIGAPAWTRALVLRCQALLGPAELAESGYLAALELHEGADRPFELARTSLLFGEWLRRGKRKTEARARLRTALEVFERLGATPWAERARTELGAAGSAAPLTAPVGPLAGLTPQEEQIARLAARGLSNREIAAQLFLSPRTVGHHLYKAYPKLGIASRGELAALLSA